jgi:hypothetical protein
MYDAAKFIGQFDSWTDVSGYIIQVAGELSKACPSTFSLSEKRAFVLGGLEALNKTWGWDMRTQPEETEEMVLQMFVQLFIR